MMSEQSNREWLASLADDQVSSWPVGLELDDEDVVIWQAQQLATAAIRGESLANDRDTAHLLAAVRQQYVETQAGAQSAHALNSPPQWWQRAANDAQGAWPWAAGVVLAIGLWITWPGSGVTPVVVAQAPVQPVLSGGVLRDPQLDALLQSHRQWGGGSALQFPAGYVRNVALDR